MVGATEFQAVRKPECTRVPAGAFTPGDVNGISAILASVMKSASEVLPRRETTISLFESSRATKPWVSVTAELILCTKVLPFGLAQAVAYAEEAY